MISLTIKDVLKHKEYRVHTKTTDFMIYLDIYGLNLLNTGDKLMLHEDLLDESNENYTMPLFFEINKEKTAKEIKQENNKEFGVIRTNGKTLAIKRIYG